MKLFLDSSALAKRYISESGSATVNEHCKKADQILISIISVVEILSVFNRLKSESRLTPKIYRILKNTFLNEVSEVLLIGVNEEITESAVLFLEKAPLKSLDAIILSSAFKSNADLFLSSDKQQVAAAKKLGVKSLLV